jgi:hypothetical protein
VIAESKRAIRLKIEHGPLSHDLGIGQDDMPREDRFTLAGFKASLIGQ